MAIFSSLLIVFMALINVAFSSTVFLSELQSVVTSIHYVTSFTSVYARASTSSHKACEAATVTESMTIPNSTVTVPGHYEQSTVSVAISTEQTSIFNSLPLQAMSTSIMNVTKTITTSSTTTITRTSKLMNHTISTMTEANATSWTVAPTLTLSPLPQVNQSSISRTKIVVTRTGSSAMMSATYPASNSSLPLLEAG